MPGRRLIAAGIAVAVTSIAPGCAPEAPEADTARAQTLLVFERIAAGKNQKGDIFLIQADRSVIRNLTKTKDVAEAQPSLSPDRKLVAFGSDRNGKKVYTTDAKTKKRTLTGINQDIYVVGLDGKGLKRLTTDAADDINPSWSPDGRKILFRSDRDGDNEIYVMNSDGSDQTRLTDSPARDIQPSFSPDMKKIVFISDRDTRVAKKDELVDPDVWVMNADGSNVKQLTRNTQLEGQPQFSPDGKKIVFEVGGGAGAGAKSGGRPKGVAKGTKKPKGAGDIFVMDADGRNRRNLTNATGDDTFPSWSPAGDLIAFQTNRDGQDEIYTVGLDGVRPFNLSQSKATDDDPDW